MRRFGMLSLYVGLVISAIGLVFGFTLMWTGDSAWAKPLIGMVPVGFLLIFNGLVTTLLHPDKASGNRPQGPPD